MDSAKALFLERLETLRRDYIGNFPARIQTLKDCWRDFKNNYGDEQQKSLQDLVRHAHSLKGSGATYGFNEVSDLATQLHAILNNLLEQNVQADIQVSKQINALLVSLNNISFDFDKDYHFEPPVSVSNAPVPVSNDNPSLLLLMKSRDEAEETLGQLQHYGYDITILTATDKLLDTIEHTAPFAIIMDIALQTEYDAAINKELINTIPLIILSTNEDIQTRLNAVRSGCTKFLTRPVNTSDLIDTLDSISHKKFQEANRILIVDDTKSLALFYEATLQSVGMDTCIVTDPMEVLDKLIEFNPELILMDMYMPGCDGQELAAVIRQHEAYVSIPIVFLSSELDKSKQLEAMRHGGDDFLTKPIDPGHLIKSVETRTSRYRKLRSFMVRDSLTGLYNHTKTKELLETDLYRCARNDTSLVFGMIDIDKFKSVNDTYGHPVGDKVIKSLARILKQRLRKSDIVGRYGGEEFAVVMYETDIKSACSVMNEIREHFSMVSHHAGEKEFNVTFSCGLAEYPYFDTSSELNEAADKALYQAKNAGRNCVQVADLTTF